MKNKLSTFIRLEILIHIIMLVVVFILKIITRDDDIVIAVLLVYSIMPFCYMVTGLISAILLKRIRDVISGIITAILCIIFLVVTFRGLDIYNQASFIDYKSMIIIYGIVVPIFIHVITTVMKPLFKIEKK